MIKLKYVCKSFLTPITQSELLMTGDYPVFGASGKVGYLNRCYSNRDYLGIIKDGTGVGRIRIYEKNSSLLGTLQKISHLRVCDW